MDPKKLECFKCFKKYNFYEAVPLVLDCLQIICKKCVKDAGERNFFNHLSFLEITYHR